MKIHHTTPVTLTEVGTSLANIWQAIPGKRFRKLMEPVPCPRLMTAVIKSRRGPTRYQLANPNSVSVCNSVCNQQRDTEMSFKM